MTSPGELWATVQADLRRQLPRAAYDSVLAGSELELAGAGYRLLAPTPAALEWQEGRLREVIQAALAGVLGQPVAAISLEFGLRNGHSPDNYLPCMGDNLPDPPPDAGPVSLSPGQLVAAADYYSIFFGKETKIGYAMLSHYVSLFWQPYLGPAFMLWKRLDAESRVKLDQVKNRWSEPQIITYNGLKNDMNDPHIRYICGAMMECSRSIEAITRTGQPLEQCCRKHAVTRTRTDRQQRQRCYFWYVGQLETLYNEGLISLEVRPGAHPRNHTVQAQVWRLLPLLTPAQVGQLNGELQKDHKNWLRDFGYLFNLDYSTWQAITEPRLVPLMDGYADYRQLNQPYIFAARFLNLPCAQKIGFTTLKS